MSHNQINGDLTLRSGDNSARFVDIPRPVLQALHASITGLKESFEIQRRRPASVSVEDLRQLSLLLEQWSQQYNIQASDNRFVLSHTPAGSTGQRSRINFKDIDSLVRYDANSTDPVTNCEVYFSFITKSSDIGQIHSFSIVVELRGYTRHFFFQDFDRRSDSDFSDPRYVARGETMKAKVEYTDYLVARGLVNIIDDWYSRLELVDYLKINPALRSAVDWEPYEAFNLSSAIVNYFPAVVVVTAYYGLTMNSNVFEYNGSLLWMKLAMFIVISYGAISLIFRFIFQRAIDISRDAKAIPLLDFNSGNKRQQELYAGRLKRTRKSLIYVSGSIITAFIIGVLSSVFVNFFLPM